MYATLVYMVSRCKIEYTPLNSAIILDTRHQNEFIKSHIPNSIFIGLAGGFAPWVGAMIKDIDQKIVIIANTP